MALIRDGKFQNLDGNEAVADVAFRTNEVICIYPITPASPMGEWPDEWAANGKQNIWGIVPSVTEMQSEGGASGALHGSTQTGALSTTFTASQGLLLMLPNMYKIAGELSPTVIHVSARSVACQALSIFGDHTDVMAARCTGFGMLASNSVQEAHDFALIAQAATLESRIPFLHYFDGFRTSHEIAKIEYLADDSVTAMMDKYHKRIIEHRGRGLSPENPVLRGTAQNPDVFFQARETVNPYYLECPDIVQKVMDNFAELTGRKYGLFDYHGAADAERIVVVMCSGAETVQETVDYLINNGEKVGVLKVRLYRPFDQKRFCESLPDSVKSLAVLDRTKEPGSVGEPLYIDSIAAIQEGLNNGWLKNPIRVTGGRFGLSSKEFNPAMVKAVFDNLKSDSPKNHFTIGIKDNVTNTSLEYDPTFSTEGDEVIRALFYGLGSDGTVGANKNSIKIIGENTDNHVQGYFVYDSKKAGAITVSHLRFSPKPIHSTYLVSKANFVGCHQPVFLDRYDILEKIIDGGTFLLNSPFGPEEVWDSLPKEYQEKIISKKLKFYAIDATKVAQETGMGRRINTIMQVCFFGISGVIPKDQAITAIKDAIKKTYGSKGDKVVQANINAVDSALAALSEIKIPAQVTSTVGLKPAVPDFAPDFVKKVLGRIIAGHGDDIPVSDFPVDGTYPTATTQYEKRNLALEIPVWDGDLCIQCGKCSLVCPHACIRAKVYDSALLADAPETFKSVDGREKAWKGMKFSIQCAPEDCTGCTLCSVTCPAKDRKNPEHKALNMMEQRPLLEAEKKNWDFFLKIPEADRTKLNVANLKHQQVLQPLFEFSGACEGCGETQYLKLATQLFGDRMVVANATGCSSIFGGNLPTTPWSKNLDGRGPAWSNSLFEDNAEFGLGFRLALDKRQEIARELVQKMAGEIGDDLAKALLQTEQDSETGINEQRKLVVKLKEKLAGNSSNDAQSLLALADNLVKKSVWIVGGDGWAYDIGYGGLDHVLASGKDVNILVLDTEVYSNTGGQASKATPLGGVAKFAMGGKRTAKKDLAFMAMTYKNVYVAKVAIGAKDTHTLRAFAEAESYRGPSIIVAYSHCIAHGYNLADGLHHQKAAVESGQWPLYRYNPALIAEGKNPFMFDSSKLKIPVEDYMKMENRFNVLFKNKPEVAKTLLAEAQRSIDWQNKYFQYLAAWKPETENNPKSDAQEKSKSV
ncbi:pyruvate:ferredoxin (flavodoxin) oxidoreductase [Candidatus Riflebacteria bacterium]